MLEDPRHGRALNAELAESQRLVGVLRSAVLGTPAAALLADLPPLPAAPARRLHRASPPLAPSESSAPAQTPPSAVTDRPDLLQLPALPAPPAENATLPSGEPPHAEPPPASPLQEPADADDPATGDDGLGTWFPTPRPGDPLLP